MSLRYAAILLATAALAACGGGKGDGVVKFTGLAPASAAQLAKDTRSVSTFCPGCGKSIPVDTDRCPEKKKCNVQIRWAEAYLCPSCQGTSRCTACVMMEQPDGKCYNCKGTGVLVYQGKSSNCPNCKGEKNCPICKGTRKCDYCEGAGKVPKDVVKTRAAKNLVAPEGEAPANP